LEVLTNDILWTVFYVIACFFLGLIPITVIYGLACLFDWMDERYGKKEKKK